MGFLKLLIEKNLPKKQLRILKDKYREAKRRKNEQCFLGNDVYCPCCGKRFRSFMDFSVTKENNDERFINTYKNTECPYCASMPRHRVVCNYLDENKQNVPEDKILMFGAEYSIRKWLDRNGFHYQTADLFDQTSDYIFDIQNIPFPDESWKLIICNHILEHVIDYKMALKELKRVLCQNGFLEITVPTDRNFETVYEDRNIVKKEDRVKHFGQSDHVRIFGNDFGKILEECGFLVEIVDGSTLPVEIAGVIGPANYDDNRVYICRKN